MLKQQSIDDSRQYIGTLVEILILSPLKVQYNNLFRARTREREERGCVAHGAFHTLRVKAIFGGIQF